MEVSGKKAFYNKKLKLCSLCEYYKLADWFCSECKVYICDACFEKHKEQQINRNHTLVIVGDSHVFKTKVDETFETCLYHNGELVKFYCSKHDQVCCGDCTVLNHSGCKIEFISNKSDTHESSHDCKQLRDDLNKCKTQAEVSLSLIANNRQQLSEMYEQFVRDVGTFAEEVIERINSMKERILKQGKDIMLNDKRKLDDIKKEADDLIAEISHQISLLDSQKDQPNKLFVTSRLGKSKLKRAQQNIDNIKKKNAVTNYIFKGDQTLEEITKESKGIGLLLKEQDTSYLYQRKLKETDCLEEATVNKECEQAEENYGVKKDGAPVTVCGKMLQEIKEEKYEDVRSFLFPRGNTQQDTKAAGSIQKTHEFSRQFSWFTGEKAVRVFETNEKITVKVYYSDILCLPVDCIVYAANNDLKHVGAMARAIANAAGNDFTKESLDYLKKHGMLRVGEVCSTGAGKMSYNYVIHAVGPCWSDYKPYSLGDVDRCEADLYNAMMNSLKEAEKLKMQTIAVSSLSSGVNGCPLDLCSIQYAKAVVDYSSWSMSPLREIHLVDTNIEMVQAMHETFQSMLPNKDIPKSYNKMRYVNSEATYSKDKTSPRNQHHTPGMKDADDFHKFDKGQSGLVIYPYCHRDYPPGFSKKAFSCCVGPGQNLYIYTADILNMTFKDMIACGNTPTGKTSGYLANAIQKRGGDVYDTEMTKMFDSRPKEGDVVACKSGGLRNFKWVVHVILPHFKAHSSKEDVEFKVASSFRNIFLEMKSKDCHSIALPLVGTGTGNADPVLYGGRFFEALCDFSSSNKEYAFKVHLVHYDKKSTDKAIETINKACRDIRPTQMITNRRAPKSGKTRWDYEARPKSAGFNYFEEHNSTETGEESEKWHKGRTWSGTTLDSSDED